MEAPKLQYNYTLGSQSILQPLNKCLRYKTKSSLLFEISLIYHLQYLANNLFNIKQIIKCAESGKRQCSLL